MTVASGYRLVPLSHERVDEILDVDVWAFTGDIKAEELPEWRRMLPIARARGMEIADPARGDVGALAAVNSTYTFRMRVPGGATVPVAGLTFVGVHTAHRRRGLLTAMMADHLTDARGRGEVASVLYAAEPAIYQRFGYGLAAQQLTVRVPRAAELRAVEGADDLTVRIERASLDRHGEAVAAVQRRLERPGTLTLDDTEARRARFADPESERDGFEQLRIALVESDGQPLAYAMFRRKGSWSDDGIPKGTLRTQELASLTPAAARRLWSVLLDVDLISTVEAFPLAVDDPLMWMLVDPRSARARMRDNVWLRIVDVPAALTARDYLCPVDAVIEVRDPLFPDNAGPWRVTSRDGDGHVESAHGAKPDVVLGIQELSAAYLGGVSVESLGVAGLAEEHRPGAVRGLAAAFASTRLPVSNLMF